MPDTDSDSMAGPLASVLVADRTVSAANENVRLRRDAVLSRRPDREDEHKQISDIAWYAGLGHDALTLARDVMLAHQGTSANPEGAAAPALPPIPPADPPVDVPQRRQVTAGMIAALTTLSDARNLTRSSDIRAGGHNRRQVLAVHGHLDDACGAWSIATRGYQRATFQSRNPLSEHHLRTQVRGLIYAFTPRIPACYWRSFDAMLGGGEHTMALGRLIDLILADDRPATIVEKGTIYGLLHVPIKPPHPPDIVHKFTVVPHDDL